MAIRRFRYKLKHHWLTTLNVGYITPFFFQEVTPGDTFSGVSAGIARLEPIDRPLYASLKLSMNFFFVPHRLVWPEFEDVITGADTTTPWPQQTPLAISQSLYKALGIGDRNVAYQPVNALYARAYNKIINEFYLDQSLQGALPETNQVLFQANHLPDYYSSIRDEIQQGNEETVDTSGATLGVTAIRDAMNRQRFRERRSQYGERYTDYLRALGLRVPDSRLDRPEHVARATSTIGISEVVSTTWQVTGGNIGHYKGHGIAGMRIRFPKRSFNEHGTLMGLIVARPRLQLRHRYDAAFFVNGKDDLHQPELSSDTQVAVRLGEINSKEDANINNVYGYQARDEWLRTARDTIAGKFQDVSNDAWHMSKDYTAGATPSIGEMMRVEQHLECFQNQTWDDEQIKLFFEHKIGKSSIIPRRKR